MKLFLVQHGEAMNQAEDPARPLTEKGKLEVERVARAAHNLEMNPECIFHSGKLRAEQTAESIASVLGVTKLEAVPGLNPNDEVSPWSKKIALLDDEIALVGHLPFMDMLASLLLCGDEHKGIVRLRYGAIVCLERDPEGNWRILWLLSPEMV